MERPPTPVERLRAFRPPFCPWRTCADHTRDEPGYRFRLHGRYATRAHGEVPRFRCSTCRRTFSRQTFSVTYYAKRPNLLAPIAAQLQAGAAHRQIARTLGCAPSSVTRRSAPLGRHALLLHARARACLQGRLTEPVVLDHAGLFEFSQDLPFGLATPVGADSWYCYEIDPAPQARAGPRSASQQQRLDTRPARRRFGGFRGSTQRVVDLLLGQVPSGEALRLVTDGHPAYRHVVRRHPARDRIRHAVFPNPERGPKGSPRSAEAKARDRAMFPVDLWHMLIRHTCAHHRRETIAFGRRINAVMERMYLTVIWRNFVKGRSERKPDPTTPAMKLGLAREPWSWQRVLSGRLFPGRERLTELETILYRRDWTTPVLPTNHRHRLRQAY